jgi:hypothetical protein
LPQRGSEHKAEGTAVRVLRGKLPLAETAANQFGEFQLEFDASSELYVAIGGNGSSETLLPLYGIHAKPLET